MLLMYSGGTVLSDISSWRQVVGDDAGDDIKCRRFQSGTRHSISYRQHCLR